MSDLDEKLNSLKKKKLTAKTIVEQQRKELRVLKSSLTLNERLEEIFRRFPKEENVNVDLYRRIMQMSNDDKDRSSNLDKQIQRTIEDLSKLIEQILTILSISSNINWNNDELHDILKKQKESFQLIKWKLSDIYAHRLAEEVSCITS